MTTQEMYNMFVGSLPVAAHELVSPANFRPASPMFVGLQQLKEKNSPKGNYATGRALSYSSLKEYAKHPLCYVQYVTEAPSAPTEAQALGLYFEALLAGKHPDNVVSDMFRPEPEKNFTSKINREWRQFQESTGKIVLSTDASQRAQEMCEVIFTHCGFFKAMKPIITDYQKVHTKQVCQLDLTCVTDFETPSAVIELKTTNNVSDFRNQYFKNYYWLQSAIQGALTGKAIYLLVVQTEPPYLFDVIHVTDDQIQEYQHRLKSLLLQFRSSLRHGFGHKDRILTIEPTYNFKHTDY